MWRKLFAIFVTILVSGSPAHVTLGCACFFSLVVESAIQARSCGIRCQASSETAVTGLSPRRGSVAGATEVKIIGKDFPDPYSQTIEAIFFSDSNQYPCNLNLVATSETIITCDTTGMPQDTYYLKLSIDGKEIEASSYCNGVQKSWECTFQTWEWRTPVIYGISPSTGVPDIDLTITGKIYTDGTQSSQPAATNGNTAILSRAWLSGPVCDITSVALDGEDTNYGTMRCTVTSNYVASQNVSFIVDGEYGRSRQSESVMKIAQDNRLHSFQSFSILNAVSPTSGSIYGGALLTLVGNYMDDSSIKVSVGGKTCAIVDRSDTSVKCTSPDQASVADFYPGGRGLVVQIYPGLQDAAAIDGTSYEDYSGNKMTARSADSHITVQASSSPVVARIQTFFQPATDGHYIFSTNKAAYTQIFLSSDHTAMNKEELLTGSSKDLTGGRLYFMEVIHMESTENIDFVIKAYADKTEYLKSQTSESKEEVQSIMTSSPAVNEVQTITLIDWQVNPSPVTQKLNLCVSCPDQGTCTGDEAFVISLYGISTGELLSNSIGSVLQEAINQLPIMGSNRVSVNRSESEDCYSHYAIAVATPIGSVPFTAESISSGVLVELTVIDTPQPEKNSFTVALGGVPSHSVPISDTGVALASAVASLFGTECPSHLNRDIGSQFIIHETFETEGTGSVAGERSGEESYCGQFSIECPGVIFSSDETTQPYRYQMYPDICLAYKGEDIVQLHISYYYTDFQTQQIVHDEADLPLETSEWNHYCFDLALFARNALDIYVTAVYIRAPVSSKFFIDNVFIGKLLRSETELTGLRTQRRLPKNPARFSSVFATKEDDVYTVTMVPIECAYNIPLLEIAYATESTAGAYSDLTWGTSKIVVDRVTAASQPPGGTFSVTLPERSGTESGSYGGTLEDIPWDAEASVVESRIETLPGITDVSVERTGTCRGYTWAITFIAPGGKQSALQASGSFVNGDATISAQVLSMGGIYLNPIRGDWWRVAHNTPQVEVTINNVPGLCNGSCSYEWAAGMTPTVTDVSLENGVISIAGTGFSATMAENSATVGGVACAVTSASETEMTCDLGESPGGTQNLVVNVQGKGNAEVKTIAIPVRVDGISPATGSNKGGTKVTLTGTGFSDEISVTIKDSPCTVSASHYTMISCTTGPSPSGDGAVSVTAGDIVAVASATYTYEDATAIVISFTPTTLSTVGGENLTLTGSGFGTTSTENFVSIGAATATVFSWTDTEIITTAPSLPPGSYDLHIHVHPGGSADVTGVEQVRYILEVTAVAPTSSSLMGGIQLVITGAGFDADPTVMVGETDCPVSQVTPTSITCTLGSSGTQHNIDNNGTSTHGTGYAWEPSFLTVKAGDRVTWRWTTGSSVVGTAYTVHTLANSSATEYDNNGFDSGLGTEEGSYTYQFNIPGTYNYGGCANTDCSVFMRGTVEVTDAADVTELVYVEIAGHEAIYLDEAGNVMEFQFSFQASSTPIVTKISPNSGTSDTLITLTGTGLASTASPIVLVGGSTCTIESMSDSSILCKIQTNTGLTVGVYHDVSLEIPGKGFARLDIKKITDRNFALLPHIASLTPATGSIAGGTELTITGGGLSGASSVTIAGTECHISSASYTSVVCTTGESVAGIEEVAVLVVENKMSLDARCIQPSCTFEYSETETPTLTLITPTSVSAPGTVLTITGTGFGTDASSITVKMAEIHCAVSSVTDTSVECATGDLVNGVHILSLNVAGKGNTQNEVSTNITSVAETTGVSPSKGSLAGGTILRITGNGFSDTDTTVLVGTSDCAVLEASISSITCQTTSHVAELVDVMVTSKENTYPPLTAAFEYSTDLTPAITAVSPSAGVSGDVITLTGTGLNGQQATTVDIGGISCTVITPVEATSVTCTLGDRYSGVAAVSVMVEGIGLATVDASVSFGYDLRLDSITPTSGSLGGGQTVTLDGFGFGSTSKVTICGQDCSNVRNVAPKTLTCTSPSSSTSTSCDVAITNGNDIASLQCAMCADPHLGAYSYDVSLTATVASVSPTSGGTAGGTTLTMNGTNLSGVTKVDIDGSPCIIDSGRSDATQVVCTTGAHTGSMNAKVVVTVGENGNAVSENNNFYYVDRWSSIYTWGGGPLPREGEFVEISKGNTILLDTETPILSMLLIRGGSLVFSDEELVHLQAENILITDGGLLQIGTEDTPYGGKLAKITLHGHLRSPELPIYGAKTLGVRKGTLDLHGKPVGPTWDRLAETAKAGETSITLQQAVPWEVGSEILIASTGDRHSQSENEQKTISTIETVNGRSVITLKEALEYEHLGTTETYSNGVAVEMRAEVGLLSRNIVIEGSNDQAWNTEIPRCEDGFDTGMFTTQTCFQGRFGEEVGSDQFGGSIMMHAKSPNTNGSAEVPVTARIENTELTYMGQAFRLGRYPIHFHLTGWAGQSYVRECAIHHTFNRAVTIHGTYNLLVERNVGYDIMGGAFFIEDGIETGNILQYNLAVFVRQSTSLLNDDITPAAYWITNPNNIVRHNHAAGGTHFGFWYRMHEHPDGPSFTTDVWQQKVELGVFYNNTVHSQGWFGLWIFQEYFPQDESGLPSPAKFRSLTAWNCEKGAEWVDCGAIQFIDFVLVNNEVTGIDVKLISDTRWGEERGAMIKDATIVGSPNRAKRSTSSTASSSIGIILPFASGLTVDGAHFENTGTALSVTEITGTCSFECGGFQYRVRGLSFTNVQRRVLWRWFHEGCIVDEDGSFSGSTPGSKVVPASGIVGGACETTTQSVFGGDTELPSAICEPSVDFVRWAFNNPFPSSLSFKNAFVMNEYGNVSSQYHKKRLTHPSGWMFLLKARTSYTVSFEDGDRFSNISYSGAFYDMAPTDWVIIRHYLFQMPDRVSMAGGKPEVVGNTSELNEDSEHLDWHYSVKDRYFEYMVSGRPDTSEGNDDVSAIPVSSSVYRCNYEDCVQTVASGTLSDVRNLPTNYTTVTNSTEKSDCFQFEGGTAMNNDVTIPEDCWVMWAIPDITVNKLHVLGNLYFDPIPGSITLSAIYIIVEGRMIAGWGESDPHTKPLTIHLRGEPDDPEYLASSGVTVGNKAIACLGLCKFHGTQRLTTMSTKLRVTAPAGSDTLTLQDCVDWTAGDMIGVAPSGFHASQTEINTIESVSADGCTLTLENSLKYEHKHVDEQFGESWRLDMSAEVAMFSRTIKILGVQQDENDGVHGFRILVAPSEKFNGVAKFSNVEFANCGQEGYIDPWDPRYCVAFVNAGTSCEVKDCSFHHAFNAAIGIYGTSSAIVTDNVIYHTVRSAIVVQSSAATLTGNLVMLNLFQGSYLDRFEEQNYKFPAAIDVEEASLYTMINNTVAGAERVGFKAAGQPCADNPVAEWSGNRAHAVLHGYHQMKSSGTGCSLVSGLVIDHAYDFGIYHQSSDSLKVENTSIVDATVGLHAISTGPAALTHEYEEKYVEVSRCLLAARSHLTDCTTDMDEERDPNLILRRIAGVNKKPPVSGRCGILSSSFVSAQNGAPFKPFHNFMSYPVLHGEMRVRDSTFMNFKDVCPDGRDFIFYANPKNEDAIHPTYFSQSVRINVDDESYSFIDRASISAINPSDCVDMQCDGRLKVLIVDDDGTLLGKRGSIIPQSEYEWDGDPRRGLGDYRIPKPLLVNLEGNRIDVDTLFQNKGILRNGACSYEDTWPGYECIGEDAFDYHMLIVESLDSDTETRRLSPVSLSCNGYIDLINGPQDHGWCAGYTCQKRISTFYMIVANANDYTLHFTGTPPNSLRLHLLHSISSDMITVKIWMPTPHLLKVFTEDMTFVPPTNAGTDANGKDILLAPPASDPQRYTLTATGASHGQNYLERSSRYLYVAVGGSNAVLTIVAQPVVIITFGFPAVTIDEFFGDNIVTNLARFLEIPEDKIRRVDIQEESRRKRSTDATIAFEVTADTAEEANTYADSVANAHQTETLSSEIGSDVVSLQIARATTSEQIPVIDANLAEGEDVKTMITYTVPDKMMLATSPSGEEGATFSVTVHLLDDSDQLVSTSSDWAATVTLDTTHADGDPAAVLSGTTTVTFVEGQAKFSDLVISHSGTYTLSFASSQGTISNIMSSPFGMMQRTVGAKVIGRRDELPTKSNGEVEFTLQLTDKDGNSLENIAFKGYAWKLVVGFDDASAYNPAVLNGGTTILEFDTLTGQVSTAGLSLTGTTVYNKYNLQFRVYSVPAAYDFIAGIEKVQIYPEDSSAYIHDNDDNLVKLTLKFSNSYTGVISNTDMKETLESAIYNSLREDYPNVYFKPLEALDVDGKLHLDTSITAVTSADVDNFLDDFSAVTARGFTLTLLDNCGILTEDSCRSLTASATTASMQESNVTTTMKENNAQATLDKTTTIIIFSVLGACILLSAVIVTITCYYKRSAELRKISALRCMNNSQSSTDSNRPLSNSLDSFQPGSTEWQRGMTPVA